MSELVDIKQLRIGDKIDCVASVCGNYGACSGGTISAIRYFPNGECRSWVEIEGCWTPFRGSAATVLVSDLRYHAPEKKEKPLEVGDKIDCTFEGRTYTGWTITSLCGPSMWDSGMVNIAFGNSSKTMNYARVPLSTLHHHVPEELKVGDIVSATYEDEMGNSWFCHCGKIVERSYCDSKRIPVLGEWVQKAPKSGRFTYCFLVLKEKVKKLPEANMIPAAKLKPEPTFEVGDLVTASDATYYPGIKCVLGVVKRVSPLGNKKTLFVEGAWVRSPATPVFKDAHWVEIDKATKFNSYADGETLLPIPAKPEVKYVPKVGDKVKASQAMHTESLYLFLGLL